MTAIIESPSQPGNIALIFSPYVAGGNTAPVVTPPANLSVQFANGGAGLSKSNAQLQAWLAQWGATDAEDGALSVTVDLSPLADPIPAGTHTVTGTSQADSSGLTGSAQAQIIVTEAQAANPAPISSGNYAQISATVGDSANINGAANFSDPGDTLTFTATGLAPGLSINASTGLITGGYTAAGGYTATITATDSVGQTATALLPVVVAAASGNVVLFPIRRTVQWDELQTPDLIIGDTFWHLVTLLQGPDSDAYDISAADSVTVAVVMSDHSKVLCDPVAMSPATAGANWSAGLVSLLIPAATTEQIAEHVTMPTIARIEIEAVMGGNPFTWFAPVKLIPGYVN